MRRCRPKSEAEGVLSSLEFEYEGGCRVRALDMER
jgi:hypothetical protein